MEVINQVRKFFEEEFDYRSPISSQVFTDMAAALNAFCDFTGGKCTTFNQDGFYASMPNSSFIIAMGRGGQGGGGGGTIGHVLAWNGSATTEFVPTFTIETAGVRGQPGGNGSDTIFGLDTIAKGGNGGQPGSFNPPSLIIDEVGSNTTVYTSNGNLGHFEDFLLRAQCYTDIVEALAAPGAGGFGRESGTMAIQTNGNDGYPGDGSTLAGTRGYAGQPGGYGFKFIKAQPSTTYAVNIGSGGTGGAGAPSISGTTNWGTLTISGTGDGNTGSNGNLTIYEFGF